MSTRAGRQTRRTGGSLASDAEVTASVRRDLERRYLDAFGCSSELAPWGPSWLTVFEEARAADEAYERGAEVLGRLQATLREAHAFLEAQGRTSPPHSLDKAVGLTPPEVVLYAAFYLEAGGVLAYAREVIDLYAKSLVVPEAERTSYAIAQIPHQRESFERHLRADLEAPSTARRRLRARLADLYRTHGTTRRIQRWDKDALDGTPFDSPKYHPVIGGAPPRAPGSSEWRRALLVQLLDTWLVEGSATSAARRISDSQIAVVNLLQGRLDELAHETTGMKLLRAGTPKVLNFERKAVALARGRRGPLSTWAAQPAMKEFLATVGSAHPEVAIRSERPNTRRSRAQPPAGGERTRRETRRDR